MPIIYRIKDWEQHYETSETRKLKRLDWVKLSTKLNGDCALTLIEGHKDGPTHWAAWVAIIQVAAISKQRGVLIQDNGEPHTAETLSRKTHLPKEWFEGALSRLASSAVGWVITESHENLPVSPGNLPPSPEKIPPSPDVSGSVGKKPGADKNGNGDGDGETHRAAAAAVRAADPPSEPEVLPQLPTHWEQFKEAIDSAGMRYSMPDLQAMQQRWESMALSEQLAAVHHIHESINAGAFDVEQYVPAARNFLFSKLWQRGVRERAGPRTDDRNIRALHMLVAQREKTG